jgi:hypothetical protein
LCIEDALRITLGNEYKQISLFVGRYILPHLQCGRIIIYVSRCFTSGYHLDCRIRGHKRFRDMFLLLQQKLDINITDLIAIINTPNKYYTSTPKYLLTHIFHLLRFKTFYNLYILYSMQSHNIYIYKWNIDCC